MNISYQQKYFKYKKKYLEFKENVIEPDSYNLNDTYFYYTNDNNIENFSNLELQHGGEEAKNILGTKLIPCCKNPCKNTGYYRNGHCVTGPSDIGTHIVCAIVDDNFLAFTKSKGNDLITPNSYFPGLKSGDSWCLCILRWIEAYEAGVAPKIVAESTNEIAGNYIDKKILLQYSL